MPLKIELGKLRQSDQRLVIDHSSNLFDIDDEDWTFDGQVMGEVTFHIRDSDIFAKGTLTTHAEGRCDRCLEPVPTEIVVPINYVFHPKSDEPQDDVLHDHVMENAPELAYYAGETINPLDQLRESILLALPLHPKCVACEENEDPIVHREDFPDEDKVPEATDEPDWKKKLKQLKGEG